MLLFWGCAEGGGLRGQGGGLSGKLRSADCDTGIGVYRQLLQLPPHAGVVSGGREAILSSQAQEQAAADFAAYCRASMVGSTGRAVIRCWADSKDASSFRSCNDRF
jgi:hypothetical protein